VQLIVTDRSGVQRTMPGREFDLETSGDVFAHGGDVARIDVVVPIGAMRR
jgi:hypothetical protein